MSFVRTFYVRWQTLVHEIAKFGIVGAFCYVIDVGLFNVFHFGWGWGPITSKTLVDGRRGDGELLRQPPLVVPAPGAHRHPSRVLAVHRAELHRPRHRAGVPGLRALRPEADQPARHERLGQPSSAPGWRPSSGSGRTRGTSSYTLTTPRRCRRRAGCSSSSSPPRSMRPRTTSPDWWRLAPPSCWGPLARISGTGPAE